mgnify:CR=1 FL=1
MDGPHGDATMLEDLESLDTQQRDWRQFPWWLLGIFLIAVYAIYIFLTRPSYQEAFQFIMIGLGITISTSLYAYLIALVLGLLAGLGRISNNIVIKNLATLYVELVRGIPILVLIFYLALVAVPGIADAIPGISNDNISLNFRAIIALSVTYGAFLAEIFRAGIQSIGRGQMEAARSLGMSYGQAMRHVILPQAIRNVLPALGNDFVAMVKDSSLVSVLAVRDITQVARLYAGRTFRFAEAYTVLAVMYLALTLILSFLVKRLESRLEAKGGR